LSLKFAHDGRTSKEQIRLVLLVGNEFQKFWCGVFALSKREAHTQMELNGRAHRGLSGDSKAED
jgi:hypothetical protein